MTYSKQITLWCDGENCGKWIQETEPTVRMAVSWARGQGWTSPSWDEHYCPDCSGGSNG
jgi:hypothetical protein